MKLIPFLKMHGCGNDYVFLDAFSHDPPGDLSGLSTIVSNRHLSVGGDGLVLMEPARHPRAKARMRMFNADGSEGSLCGNALRCMALWLHQTRGCPEEFQVEMGERLIDVKIVSSDVRAGKGVVRVQIGHPLRLNPKASGRAEYLQQISAHQLTKDTLEEENGDWQQYVSNRLHVSMGNPHLVLFVSSLTMCAVDVVGPRLETHPLFPDRTNVEFVEILSPSRVKVRVWERGSGETMACGSGACAVAVAGIGHNLLQPALTDGAITVQMPGGELRVIWNSDDLVELEGAAEIAFTGALKLSGLCD